MLQQAVLWNLALLAARPINMSPYFLSSNEDVSMSNYLKRYNFNSKNRDKLCVIKVMPDDNVVNMPLNLSRIRDAAAQKVSIDFERMLLLFYIKERDLKINDQNTNLLILCAKTIIPNSQINNPSFQFKLLTESRAIEQTLSAATEEGWAPANIFNPYGDFIGLQIERIMAA